MIEYLFKTDEATQIKAGKWTGTEVYWKREKGTLFFIIPGSEHFKNSSGRLDWFFNALIIPFPSVIFKGIIHLGFWLKSISVISEILKCAEEQNPDKIVFVGHSAGGAVCLLCHRAICGDYDSESHAYGTPAPLWLWPFFLKDKKSKVYRNGWDLVPYSISIFLYSHGCEIEGKGKSINLFEDHMPGMYRETFK